MNFHSERFFKKLVFIFPIIAIFFFVFLKIEFTEIYRAANREDGFIEYTQSLAYLLSSIIAILIALRFFKTSHNFYGVLYLVLSFSLFFVCMEEIGWGERIFRLTIPEYFKAHNVQREISFHNLSKARPYVNELYILIGFYGAFLWMILPEKTKTANKRILNYIVPDWFLTFYFIPVLAIYTYIAYISGIAVRWFKINAFHIGHMDGSYFVEWRDQEPAELLLSFGFLLFVLVNKYRQNRNINFEERNCVRFTLAVFLASLIAVVPAHFIHVTVSKMVYPYDHMDLGNVYYSRGKFHEAIDQYVEALQIDPIHAESHYNLANALTKTGKTGEAIDHYSKALNLKPAYAEAHYNLGNALFQVGKINEAIRHYDETLRLEPNQANAHNNLGNSLARIGRLEEAILHYSEALRIQPNFIHGHYNLGMAYMLRGNFRGAAEHFHKALRLNPHFEPARRKLERVLEALEKENKVK